MKSDSIINKWKKQEGSEKLVIKAYCRLSTRIVEDWLPKKFTCYKLRKIMVPLEINKLQTHLKLSKLEFVWLSLESYSLGLLVPLSHLGISEQPILLT